MLGLLLSSVKSTVSNLNCQTLKRLDILRRETPPARHLVIAGDGSHTHKTILRGKPAASTHIARTRKDMVVHYPPAAAATGANGRPPCYGPLAASPPPHGSVSTSSRTKTRVGPSGRVNSIESPLSFTPAVAGSQ